MMAPIIVGDFKLSIHVISLYTIVQLNLSKLNLLKTTFYVQNRQVFGLYRLN